MRNLRRSRTFAAAMLATIGLGVGAPAAFGVDYRVRVLGAGRVQDHLASKQINCSSSISTKQGTLGRECFGDYPNAWSITFTPTAADGWAFEGWKGVTIGSWAPVHCDHADESHWLPATKLPDRPYPSICTFGTSVVGDPDWAVEARFVDVRAPETELVSGTTGRTGPGAKVKWSFKEPDRLYEGSSFECSIDRAAWKPCRSGEEYDNADYEHGEHRIEIRAKDPSGNVDADPVAATWTVDRLAPDTTIATGPPSPTSGSQATFSFALAHETGDAGGAFECNLDGGGWQACGTGQSGTAQRTVGEGRHTFAVRASDVYGNVDPTPAERTWVVDTGPPNTAIASVLGNGAVIAASTLTVGFSSEPGATFQCALDGAPFGVCSGPGNFHTLVGLADGPHVLQVRAIDAVGNLDASPARRVWTVDTTAPDTTVTAGPADGAGFYAPNTAFAFTSEPRATFQCRQDGQPFGPCSSAGSHALSGLAPGVHTFQVRALDRVGNADASPATRTFTVLAPAVAITGASLDATWKRSVLTSARLRLSGTLTSGGLGQLTVTIAGQALRIDAPPGPFGTVIELPAAVRSRATPGAATVQVSGTSNGLPVPPAVATVRVASPPEGVVVRAKISTRRNGRALTRASTAKRLWATFEFAAAGKPRRAIRAHWSRNGKPMGSFPTAAPRASSWIGRARGLAKGRYTCALKMGKTTIKTVTIRVG